MPDSIHWSQFCRSFSEVFGLPVVHSWYVHSIWSGWHNPCSYLGKKQKNCPFWLGMSICMERDTVFVTISGMYSRREQCVLGGVVYLTRVPLPGNPYLNVLLSTFCGRGYLHLSPTSLNKHTLVWPCWREIGFPDSLECQHGKKNLQKYKKRCRVDEKTALQAF